jgi:putative membrane protein
MFNRYFDLTIAVLTGFLIGSLNKVWPWKETMEVFVKHAGTAKEKVVPLVEKNILPATFEQINGVPSQIVLALVMAIAGAAIVLVLHRFSPKTEE